MSRLGNYLSRLSSSHQDFFDATMASFDKAMERMQEVSNKLYEGGKKIYGEVSDLVKMTRDGDDYFKITVPFNPKKENLRWEIGDGAVHINVSSSIENGTCTKSSSRDYTFPLPSTCSHHDAEELLNDTLGTASIIVKKEVQELGEPTPNDETVRLETTDSDNGAESVLDVDTQGPQDDLVQDGADQDQQAEEDDEVKRVFDAINQND